MRPPMEKHMTPKNYLIEMTLREEGDYIVLDDHKYFPKIRKDHALAVIEYTLALQGVESESVIDEATCDELRAVLMAG